MNSEANGRLRISWVSAIEEYPLSGVCSTVCLRMRLAQTFTTNNDICMQMPRL